MSKDSRARSWCFTLNNWDDISYENIINLKYKYLIIGKEIGEKEKTPHLQGYISFEIPKRFSVLKKINKNISWRIAKGTALQNKEYCSKQGDWKEYGEIPKQGKRTDLIKIKNDIEGGKRVDEITLENPMVYHQYGRTLNKLEDIILRKKFRTWQTTCNWYYGETGCGKSHKAFENYNPETMYVYPKDNGWWDGYIGQETVIIDEFRGEIMYADLLQLIDRWPKSVKRRNREPFPFLAKHIIITSSMHPNDVYHNLSEKDKLNQLLRRIKLIKLGTDGTEVVSGNTSTDTLVKKFEKKINNKLLYELDRLTS